jgi:hypothetical protein
MPISAKKCCDLLEQMRMNVANDGSGKWLVSVRCSDPTGNGDLTLSHDKPLETKAEAEEEGRKYMKIIAEKLSELCGETIYFDFDRPVYKQ